LNTFGQEKRLALVIGNNDYLVAPLKNAANDAILVAQTLEALNFDVILDTNVTTKQQFLGLVQEFGNRRQDYDVGFVYYAGHGVEINQKNYLLATRERYESIYDAEDYGMPVESIIRYLTRQSEQVNVIILDACRDNPYESKWKGASRGGSTTGVARIPTPNGTLVAYSTEAGSTALDGELMNSFYTSSLCKNMQLKDVSLDQVFRNVRADVLQDTDGAQRPIEFSQLTGSTYFLNPTTNTELLKEAESLNNEGKPQQALILLGRLLELDSVSMPALLLKGELLEQLDPNYYGEDYLKCIQYHDKEPLPYLKYGEFLARKEQFEQALESFQKCLLNDSTNAEAQDNIAYIYLQERKDVLALEHAKAAVSLNPKSPDYRTRLSECYITLKDTVHFYELITDVLNTNPHHPGANYYFTKYELEQDRAQGTLITIDHPALRRYAALIDQMVVQKPVEIARFLSTQADLYYSFLSEDEVYQAIAKYREANNLLNTPNWRNLFAVAQIYYDLERWEESIAEINRILKEIPTHVPSLILKGQNLYLLDREGEAIDVLNKALNQDSCNQTALELIGDCNYYLAHPERDNYEDHITRMTSAYKSAIGCCERPEAQLNLLDALIEKLYYEDRTEQIEMLFANFDQDFKYISKLVQVRYYYSEDSLDLALSINSKLLADTSNADLNYWQSLILQEKGDFEAALTYLESAIDFFNKDGCVQCGSRLDLELKRVECLAMMSRIDKSKTALNSLSLTSQADSGALSLASYNIADHLLYESEDYHAAFFWADHSIRLDPYDHFGYLLRSDIYHKLNKIGFAFNDLSSAVALKDGDKDAELDYCLFKRAVYRSENMRDHSNAIEDMKRSKAIADACDDVEGALQATNWIGAFFDRLNLSDSANYYYSLTIENSSRFLEDEQLSTAPSYASMNMALNHFVKDEEGQGLVYTAMSAKLVPKNPYFLILDILAREYAHVSNQREIKHLSKLLSQ
jgi:tetratricopeptide (TPR) repeat protein